VAVEVVDLLVAFRCRYICNIVFPASSSVATPFGANVQPVITIIRALGGPRLLRDQRLGVTRVNRSAELLSDVDRLIVIFAELAGTCTSTGRTVGVRVVGPTRAGSFLLLPVLQTACLATKV